MREHARLAVWSLGLAAALSACGGAAEPRGATPLALKSGMAARVIRVPQDRPTFADAMVAAMPGDVVSIAPGTYQEPLILRAGVRVVGGPSTIDAAGLDHGITADSTVRAAAVSGITVQGARSDGILLDGASVSMEQVVSRASGGAGLVVRGGGKADLTDCELSSNAGWGLVATAADVAIERSRVLDNGSAGLYLAGSVADVSASLFRGNGGIANVRVSHGSEASLERNQILGGAGGVDVDDGLDPADPRPATAILSRNVVSGTRADGLLVTGGTARTESNHFDGNGRFGLLASGRNLAAPLARVESEGDTFDRNQASGVVAQVGAAVTLRDASVSQNRFVGVFATGAALICGDAACLSRVLAQGPNQVDLDGVRVEDNPGAGVEVFSGSHTSIRRSSLARNSWGNSGTSGLFVRSELLFTLPDGTQRTIDQPTSALARDTRIEGNNGWCARVSANATLDLGNHDGGGNSCVGNSMGGVANATWSGAPVPAKGNWWGTADASVIAAMMVGSVEFEPFLAQAP